MRKIKYLKTLKSTTFLFCLISILSGSCATTKQTVDLPTSNVQLSSGEAARIELNRDTMLPHSAYTIKIFDSNNEIGKIANGGRLYWDREPGLATLIAEDVFGNRLDPLLLNANGGVIYYININPMAGFYRTGQESVVNNYAPRQNERPPHKSTEYSGTGFSISENGYIITANHVISDALAGESSIFVKFSHENNWTQAEIVRTSQATDLALLKRSEQNSSALAIDLSTDTRSGEKVFTYGFPFVDMLGDEAKYSEGNISSLSGLGGEQSLLQISLPVQPGNSGGPLLNTNGEVIGIITSTAAIENFYNQTGSLPQNINWAVKSSLLNMLLNDIYIPELNNIIDPVENAKNSVCQIRVSVQDK